MNRYTHIHSPLDHHMHRFPEELRST